MRACGKEEETCTSQRRRSRGRGPSTRPPTWTSAARSSGPGAWTSSPSTASTSCPFRPTWGSTTAPGRCADCTTRYRRTGRGSWCAASAARCSTCWSTCAPDPPPPGSWFGIELSADNGRMLYVPPMCAHGYQTLEAETEILLPHVGTCTRRTPHAAFVTTTPLWASPGHCPPQCSVGAGPQLGRPGAGGPSDHVMNTDTALRAREAEGRPVRVALVGAGATGRAIALQLATPVPGHPPRGHRQPYARPGRAELPRGRGGPRGARRTRPAGWRTSCGAGFRCSPTIPRSWCAVPRSTWWSR